MPLLTPNKNLPCYTLSADPNVDDSSGLTVISMVEDPAIQQKFQLFKANQQRFAVSDTEQRIVSGPALIPNEPIYRNDESGQYNVMFTPESIKTLVQKFFKTGRQNNSSFEHDGNLVNGIYLFESFIVDSKRGNLPNARYKTLPDGTWFVSFKVDNPEIWDQLKSGKFTGFSVEGMFDHLIEGTSLAQQMQSAPRVNNNANNNTEMKLKFHERVLNAVFGRQRFDQQLLSDGTIIKYEGPELTQGMTVFMQDPTGSPSLLADGDYRTKDTATYFTIKDGAISDLKPGQPDIRDDETKHQAQAKAEPKNVEAPKTKEVDVVQPSKKIEPQITDEEALGYSEEDEEDEDEDSEEQSNDNGFVNPNKNAVDNKYVDPDDTQDYLAADQQPDLYPVGWDNLADDKKTDKPYGDVEYAYVGKDGEHKYPIDTEEHIRAAWNYINKAKNAGMVEDPSAVKSKIISAWKAKIDPKGPPSAQKTSSKMKKIDVAKAKKLLAQLAEMGLDPKSNLDELTHVVETGGGAETTNEQPCKFDTTEGDNIVSKLEEMAKSHEELKQQCSALSAKFEEAMAKHHELAQKFEDFVGKSKEKEAELSSQIAKFGKLPAGNELSTKEKREAAEKEINASSSKLENMFLSHRYRQRDSE